MPIKLLFLDCEMGGIGLDKSLLQIAMDLHDEKGCPFGKMYWACLKPDNGVYQVEAEALVVNQINLIEHDKHAITYTEASREVYDFIKFCSHNGKEKLIPAGWNISGDLSQIWDKLVRRGSWEQFVSYRLFDLASVARYLVTIGKLPEEVTSLQSCLQHFFGKDYKQYHNAVQDVSDIVKVYRELIRP